MSGSVRPGTDRLRDSPMAMALKEFLRGHRSKYPSMTAFAKAVGLSRHTIMQICDGSLTTITPNTRSAIFAHTGLLEFAPGNRQGASKRPARSLHEALVSPTGELQQLQKAAAGILRTVGRLQELGRSDLGSIVTPIKSEDPEQHVERVRQVLTALDQELAFFRETDRERAREALRTRIDPKDVGYIIALLRALYSKEAFDNWVLASGYSVRP